MKRIFLFTIIVLLISITTAFLILKQQANYFTFIILPDTQKYTMYDPQIFINQTAWIVKNRNNLNIQFVSQLGDIVQSGALENNEWETASKAMSLLEKADIPYGIIPGNHDVDTVDDTSAGFTKYNENFFISRFNTKPWFGGNYQEFQNNYQLISISGINFIIVNLEVDAADDVLEWAGDVLTKYKDRKAIVTMHAYLNDTGERFQTPHFRTKGNSGEQIWQKLIKKECNVILVLSGHAHSGDGENRLTSTNDCGKPVEQIVQNYQDRKNGGNGLLRIYKFYPHKKELYVKTYSPFTNKYEQDQDSEFTLNLPF